MAMEYFPITDYQIFHFSLSTFDFEEAARDTLMNFPRSSYLEGLIELVPLLWQPVDGMLQEQNGPKPSFNGVTAAILWVIALKLSML